jgi:hypothetical protein
LVFCGGRVIAIGCNDGSIGFLRLGEDGVEEVGRVENKYGHSKPVTQLRWMRGLLASCGEDHSVRIFRVCFDHL